MHAQIMFDHAQHSDRNPHQLHIQDRSYNSIIVFVDTAAKAGRLLAAVAAQRDALIAVEAEDAAVGEPEPTDGCSCGNPDLPGFDHNRGCPRRGEVAA